MPCGTSTPASSPRRKRSAPDRARGPGNAEAWNILGIVAYESGNAAAALENFGRAAAAAPAVVTYRGNWAAMLFGLGRHVEAEKEFREVLRRDPNQPDVHNNLANVLRSLGRLDEALASSRRALALRPAYPEAHNNLGTTLRELERHEESLACYRQALKLRPDFPEAHNNLGIALRELGRFEEALASYRRTLGLRPAYPEAHYNYGTTARDLGRLEEAEQWLRRAVALNPTGADVHNNLGATLSGLGRYDEAARATIGPWNCFRRMPRPTTTSPVAAFDRRLRRGWAEYEWRWQFKTWKTPRPSRSRAGTARRWPAARFCSMPSRAWATRCSSFATPPLVKAARRHRAARMSRRAGPGPPHLCRHRSHRDARAVPLPPFDRPRCR